MSKIEAKGLGRLKKRKRAVVVVEKQRLLMRAVVIEEEEESGLSSRRSFGSRVRVCSLPPPPSSSLKAESCLKRNVNRERSSLESMFCYDKQYLRRSSRSLSDYLCPSKRLGIISVAFVVKRKVNCFVPLALELVFTVTLLWRAKASLLKSVA